ncbi:hypothetical protein BJ912DRAFT_947867 [Pholiota molesta]|nr:hypothetical protein BJ912DRAFT_947867 [Pholiota molesta]
MVPLISRQLFPPSPPGIVSALKKIFAKFLHHPTPTAFCRDLPRAPRMEAFPFDCETGAGKFIGSSRCCYGAPRPPNAQEQNISQPYLATLSSEAQATSPLLHALNPCRLFLAPTHQLARWLSIFAKASSHVVGLHISCRTTGAQRN